MEREIYTNMHREKDRAFISWFTHHLPTTFKAGPGWSEGPGTPSRFLPRLELKHMDHQLLPSHKHSQRGGLEAERSEPKPILHGGTVPAYLVENKLPGQEGLGCVMWLLLASSSGHILGIPSRNTGHFFQVKGPESIQVPHVHYLSSMLSSNVTLLRGPFLNPQFNFSL